MKNPTPVYLTPSELEALRLVDGNGLDQEAAGQRMKVSRGTVWRILQAARKKVVTALIENRPLTIVAKPPIDLHTNGPAAP